MKNTHHTIEFDYECKDCKGTGIYVGMSEHDGFGVVCCKCKGTGKAHFKYEYDEFTKRHERKDIEQVLETNPGITTGLGKNNQFTFDSFGGMRYEDWNKGKPFPPKSEMRAFACPAWWYQTANYKLKPDWCFDTYKFGFGMFTECDGFAQKEQCWKRFDNENKK